MSLPAATVQKTSFAGVPASFFLQKASRSDRALHTHRNTAHRGFIVKYSDFSGNRHQRIGHHKLHVDDSRRSLERDVGIDFSCNQNNVYPIASARCSNGWFSLHRAASLLLQSRQLLCRERVQHNLKTSGMGSLLTSETVQHLKCKNAS